MAISVDSITIKNIHFVFTFLLLFLLRVGDRLNQWCQKTRNK